MALKGLDIFKLTPKTNCKDCGSPTCMAFSMKVAQGALPLEKCPHLSEDVLTSLSEATAPPMKTLKFGAGDEEHTLGGETVLFRHEKTYVSKNLFAVSVSSSMADPYAVFAAIPAVDYERIGERMYVELIDVIFDGDEAKYLDIVKKAFDTGRSLIIDCADPDVAKKALDITKGSNPILSGANIDNLDAMNAVATEYGVILGVSGKGLDELYDLVKKLEEAGNKNLILNVCPLSIKNAFSAAVQIRRAALKGNDRSLGYPVIVNVGALAAGNSYMQTALASLFTMRYGSIVVMEGMSYAQALPLYGLRQNIYTDPQKPMKVEPGFYPLNGADENAICLTTVDFALTYFVVSGEVERSGVPVNMLISDAGGYSVLTAWAAGKLSASSIAKFFKEFEVENKIKNRVLLIPGKVSVLKGEIEDSLPGWNIVVAPNEAVQLVKFLKDFTN